MNNTSKPYKPKVQPVSASKKDICDKYGFSMSYLDRLIRDGLPVYKGRGRRRFIKFADVEAVLFANAK